MLLAFLVAFLVAFDDTPAVPAAAFDDDSDDDSDEDEDDLIYVAICSFGQNCAEEEIAVSYSQYILYPGGEYDHLPETTPVSPCSVVAVQSWIPPHSPEERRFKLSEVYASQEDADADVREFDDDNVNLFEKCFSYDELADMLKVSPEGQVNPTYGDI